MPWSNLLIRIAIRFILISSFCISWTFCNIYALVEGISSSFNMIFPLLSFFLYKTLTVTIVFCSVPEMGSYCCLVLSSFWSTTRFINYCTDESSPEYKPIKNPMNQSQEHKSQYLSAKDVNIDPDLDAQIDFGTFQRHGDLHLGLQTFSFLSCLWIAFLLSSEINIHVFAYKNQMVTLSSVSSLFYQIRTFFFSFLLLQFIRVKECLPSMLLLAAPVTLPRTLGVVERKSCGLKGYDFCCWSRFR